MRQYSRTYLLNWIPPLDDSLYLYACFKYILVNNEAPPSNLTQVQVNKGQPAPQNNANLQGQAGGQPMMNNGSRDTNVSVPNPTTTTSDVQKLQQQLQDIKDQVNLLYTNHTDFLFTHLLSNIYFLDNVSSVSWPLEEYDIFMRSRNVSDVRRQNDCLPDMQEANRETHITLLNYWITHILVYSQFIFLYLQFH